MPSAAAPKQVSLQPQQVAPARREVQHGLDLTLLDQPARRPRAHAHLGHRAVGDVDHVGPRGRERLGGRHERADVERARRLHLDGDDEAPHSRARTRRRCRGVAAAGGESVLVVVAATTTRALRRRDPRIASATAAVCAGPVPQHPPMIDTPSSRYARAWSARYSGVAGYTNRPPTWVGPPAFGRATSGTLAGRRPHRPHHAEQLRRTFSAVRTDRVRPQLDQAHGDLRRRRAQQRAVVLRERRAHHDRDRRALPRARRRAPAPSRAGPSASPRSAGRRRPRRALPPGLGTRRTRPRAGPGRTEPAARRAAPSNPATNRAPASRASAAAARLSSVTRAARPCTSRRNRLPPNVFVRTTSAPAWTNVAVDLTRSARDRRRSALEARADRRALLDQRRAHAAVGQERPFVDERSECRPVHPVQCRSRASVRSRRRRGVSDRCAAMRCVPPMRPPGASDPSRPRRSSRTPSRRRRTG